MAGMEQKKNKWTKVNIHTHQATLIEQFLSDPKICSKFGFLSKSNFVQNAVRKEIEKIERIISGRADYPEDGDSFKIENQNNHKSDFDNLKSIPEHNHISQNSNKSEELIDATYNATNSNLTQFGMGAVARRMEFKKTIESEAKHSVTEAKLKNEIEKLKAQTEVKANSENKLLNEINRLKLQLEQKELAQNTAKSELELYKRQSQAKTESEKRIYEEINLLKAKLKEKEISESTTQTQLSSLQHQLNERDTKEQEMSENIESLQLELKLKQETQQKYIRELKDLKNAKKELEELKKKAQIEKYRHAVDNLEKIEGELKVIREKIDDLNINMQEASRVMDFEKAAQFRDQIRILNGQLEEKVAESDNFRDEVNRLKLKIGDNTSGYQTTLPASSVKNKSNSITSTKPKTQSRISTKSKSKPKNQPSLVESPKKQKTLTSKKNSKKKNIMIPPPPKMPPGPKKRNSGVSFENDTEEKDIVDRIFGDSAQPIQNDKEKTKIVIKANDLLKEGFDLENNMDFHTAAEKFDAAANILNLYLKNGDLTKDDYVALHEKIESYKDHAAYLRNTESL